MQGEGTGLRMPPRRLEALCAAAQEVGVVRFSTWSPRIRRLARDYERLWSSLEGINQLAFATLVLNFLFKSSRALGHRHHACD